MIFNIRTILLSLAAGCLVTTVSAQQDTNTSYFTVSGGVGASSFRYDLNYQIEGLQEKGKRNGKLGYEVDIRYSYFFNPNWGLATGIGISRYATVGKLKGDMSDGKYMKLGNMVDDDDLSGQPREFELRGRLKNLEEKQTAFLLDIPLMAMYQTRFGEEEKWGMYAEIGRAHV